jgi:hypothetical protein
MCVLEGMDKQSREVISMGFTRWSNVWRERVEVE